MFMNGTLSFASAIAGLSSNAGLGILVLLRKNDSIKNSLLVLGVLLLSSILAGVIIQLF